MKLTATTTRYGAYIADYDFPKEVWLEFKDTVRDSDDFPDHDEDIKFEYREEFLDWLIERVEGGDSRITVSDTSEDMAGDTTAIEWSED